MASADTGLLKVVPASRDGVGGLQLGMAHQYMSTLRWTKNALHHGRRCTAWTEKPGHPYGAQQGFALKTADSELPWKTFPN
jgi:hypothetical protein